MYDAMRFPFASDNGLECLPGAIGNDSGINTAFALQDTEYKSFPPDTTASSPSDTSYTAMRFVNIDLSLKKGFSFAQIGDTASNQRQISIHPVCIIFVKRAMVWASKSKA